MSNSNESSPASDTDPRQQLIDRIVATGPFQKSNRLPGLLRHISERTIHGHTDQLTEQEIGQAVFGKPAHYSTAEDSSVRVHVRQLRLRLHEYFDGEGRNENLIVEIPKGSYTPIFRQSESGTTEAGALDRRRQISILWIVLPWVLAGISVLTAMLWNQAATRQVRRASAPPWPMSDVFDKDQNTYIVVADSNYSILRLANLKQSSLDEYLKPNLQQSLVPQKMEDREARVIHYISDSLLTSFADVSVAVTLAKISGQASDHLFVRSARDLSLRSLDQGNYIFVGSPASNPWVSLYRNKLTFEEVEEIVGRNKYFLNKNPKHGEQVKYQGIPYTPATEDYATIALLPSASGHGNILILQGLQQIGTEALGMLLAKEEERRKLRDALGAHDQSSKPIYFEAMIRAKEVAGAPGAMDILATRIIEP